MITILIVDDNAETRQGLRLRLMHDAGLRVVGEAANGVEALVLAEHLQPDVVVIDAGAPDLLGVETARKLRAAMPDLPIVMLTLYQDAHQREAAASAGVWALFEKDGACCRRLKDLIREAAAHRRLAG
jgi:DNA-binding NarL/FixJ family response regulator